MGATNIWSKTLTADTLSVSSSQNVVRISILARQGPVTILGTSTFNGVRGFNMNFDGAWINGTYSGSQPNVQGTFEAWIYAAASEVTSGDRGTIILLQNAGCGQYMSWNKSNQYLSTYWYCSSADGYHETNGPSARKTWHHWCTVWDGRAGRL